MAGEKNVKGDESHDRKSWKGPPKSTTNIFKTIVGGAFLLYYFIFFHFGRTAVPSWQTKDVFSPVPYIVEEGPLHHKDQLPTGWGAVVFLTQGFEAQTVVEARLLPGPPWLHYEVS